MLTFDILKAARKDKKDTPAWMKVLADRIAKRVMRKKLDVSHLHKK